MINFVVGLVSGFFGGLAGLGGGVIMIPLMVRIQKLSQHKAHGTSLVALVFTGIAGAATYYFRNSVDLKSAALLALTAVVTSGAGAKYANALSERKLKRSFGAFLVFVSLLLVIKPYLPLMVMSEGQWYRASVLMSAGLLSGFLSGMMGVGGGSIMVPSMVLLAGMGQHLSQGTSLLAMVPAGSSGAYTHYKLGNVEVKLLSGLVPGIILGTWAGGMLAHYIPENILRILFAAVLIWTGFGYIQAKPDMKC